MRLLVDTVIALLLLAVLGTILWHQRADRHRAEQIAMVQQAMQAIESQSLYRAAIGDARASNAGYSDHLNPAWFDHLPNNVLVDHREVPWLDSREDVGPDTLHPRHIVADSHHAAFWYNPYRGTIRARVPAQMSWEQTVELYNQVNGTAIRVDQVEWATAAACATKLTDTATALDPSNLTPGAPGAPGATLAPTGGSDPLLRALGRATQ